jgi:hypothetical protein
MDWLVLDAGLINAVNDKKELDEAAYTVYYGLKLVSGFPTWIVGNKLYSIKTFDRDMIKDTLPRYMQPTGIIINSANKGLHCHDITYGDILTKCQKKMTAKNAVGEFKNNFNNFLSRKTEQLLTYNNPPALILL